MSDEPARGHGTGYVWHPTTRPAAEHVIVTTERGPEPGLLCMWRRGKAGWEGLVMHREWRDGAWDFVQRFTSADLIQQVGNRWDAGPPA